MLRQNSPAFRPLIRQAGRLALAALLALSSPATAADFSGRVVRVLDGDTIDVLVDRQPVRVRLSGIDAPEKRQPFGEVSRQSLASLVAGQFVNVRDQGRDRYGRVIGIVRVQGVDANRTQVRAGLAWVYTQYARDPALYREEAAAKISRAGLWRDRHPIAPWIWRRQTATNK